MEFNGKRKASWSNLAENAEVNATQIKVAHANANWAVGDEIMICPSRLNWNEGEKRIISEVIPMADGIVYKFETGLSFPHIGQSKNYRRPTDGKTWRADMRAEVGMLSKSIRIEGDASSENNQHGGHVMIMMNGQAFIDGVEFFRMGQKSILGRYPFHWHLLQEKGAGQYFKNNSVHRAYNRAITIHGTESTLVENNFCYDHIGHGLFLEDGSERFNIIRGNVMLLTKRPVAGEQVTPSDNEANEVQNRTPASYWITNPNNTFENNVAAGTQGTGFWFALPRSPMGPSDTIARFRGMQPYKEPLIKFSGNKAHSCANGFDIFDQLTAGHALIRNGSWERTDVRVLDNCTWYACELAIYGGIGGGRTFTTNVIFRNNIFLDNETSVMHANYSMVEQSLFVANSGENVFSGTRHLNRGYDGACTIKDCHLVGWQAENANYVQNTGGALKHVNYRVSGITKDHNGPPRMSFPNYSAIPKGEVGANTSTHPRFWSYIHWDIDGSLGGKANTSIVTNHPLCRDGSEVRYSNWTNLYRTDRRFAYLVISSPNGEEPKMTMVRTKPGTPKAGQYYINGFYGGTIQFPLMVNDGFLYTLQFETLNASKNFTLRMLDSYVAGDKVLLRIKDFGRIPGIAVQGRTRYNSLAALNAANSSGYAIDGGFLYLQMISVASNPDQAFRIQWTGSITLPMLDTDGDGISDKQESINGTDPIPNDPINENPAIQIAPTCSSAISAATNAICAGGSVVLTASSGTAYRWIRDGVAIAGATAQSYTATVAGSYTVEVTNAQNCKAVSPARVISVNALPVATVTSPVSTICSGSNVVLTASGGATYRWLRDGSVIAGATAQTLSVSTAGSYAVEITNAAGCRALSAPRAITVAALPVALLTSPLNSICAGASALLTASGGTSYVWRRDGIAIAGATAATYSVTVSGSYTVEVANAAGCKAISEARVITVNALPVATITSPVNSICAGGSVVLTASSGNSYRWKRDGVTIAGAAASTFSATQAGSYTVDITNAAGCMASSAARVITQTIPTASITSSGNSICAGSTMTLTASSGIRYLWKRDGVAISGATAATFSATQAGSYTVDVTFSGGCSATSLPRVLTTNLLPTASITSSASSVCAGGAVRLTSGAAASYQWRRDGIAVVGATGSFYDVTTSGSYSVEVANAAGCKATSAARVITVNPLPTATISAAANSFCSGSSVLLTSSPGTSFVWRRDGVVISAATASTFTASAAGSYTVEVSNAAGCKALSAARVITVNAGTTWYADSDGDGRGDVATTRTACTQPAGFVAVAGDACPTDPAKIAPGNCGCNKTETSCVVADISGPSCGVKGQTLSFTLDPSKRVGVTSYTWWFTGSSDLVTPSADKTSASVKLSQYFTSGDVCVGVNISAAPFYRQYCKTVNTCASLRTVEEEEFKEQKNIQIFPNPAGDQIVLVDVGTTNEIPSKIQLVNNLGNIVWESDAVQKQTALNTATLENGTYSVKIYFTHETSIQRLVIMK
jgi:hypothetical protein